MKNTVNLFAAMESAAAPKKRSSGLAAAVIVLVIIGVIMLGWYYITYSKAKLLEAEQTYLTDYINGEEAATVASQTDTLSSKLLTVTVYNDAVREGYYTLSAISEFNSEIYNKIIGCKPGYVTIYDISFSDGAVVIGCTTVDNIPPADYAQSLDKLGAFSSVGYQGFSENGDGNFIFSISCMLEQKEALQ